MLASAPSHAAVITSSVNGFTGLFDQSAWVKAPGNSNNSVTFSPSTGTATSLTIVKNNNNIAAANAKRVITTAVIDALRPTRGGSFLGWKATGNYLFTGSNLAKFDFTGESNTDSQKLENSTNPGTPVTTPTAFFVEGDGVLDDEIEFKVKRITSGAATGVGTISDFKFEAYYEDVPGPLPIVGAAAAFAWSRKLRNRLKPANTLV
jgi:hypothetical protein